MSRITDIAIIGGGASGLAAAVEAKNIMPHARVVILEKLDRVGKKLLATGNGRCNLSNINMSPEHYHGSVKNAMRIISSTPSAKEFFGSLGVICSADSKGRVYPKSNAASTVLSALRLRAAELGVTERCGFEANFIESTPDCFKISNAKGEKFPCKRCQIHCLPSCHTFVLQADRHSLTQLYAELMHTAVDMELHSVLRGDLLHDRKSQSRSHTVAAGFIAFDKRFTEPLRIVDPFLSNVIHNTE